MTIRYKYFELKKSKDVACRTNCIVSLSSRQMATELGHQCVESEQCGNSTVLASYCEINFHWCRLAIIKFKYATKLHEKRNTFYLILNSLDLSPRQNHV